MKELIENLTYASEDMKLISELTLKYHDLNIVSEMLFYKKLEDGILSKLSNATLEQLRIMKYSYKFRYYDNDITNNLIDITIKNITRKEKLKIINSI